MRRGISIALLVCILLTYFFAGLVILEFYQIVTNMSVYGYEELMQDPDLHTYIMVAGSFAIIFNLAVSMVVAICAFLSIFRLRRHFGQSFTREIKQI